jgi:hypothetical protein
LIRDAENAGGVYVFPVVLFFKVRGIGDPPSFSTAGRRERDLSNGIMKKEKVSVCDSRSMTGAAASATTK